MKLRIVALVGLFSLALLSCSPKLTYTVGKQTEQVLEKEITQKVKIGYLLYLPEEYNQSKKDWPLLMFLHGAGERGADLEKVKVHGPPKLINNGQSFPFIVVSPQCPENQWWTVEQLDVLLNEMTGKLRVDKNRIYLSGLSMGGYGTWAMAIQYPQRFAAIAPICGGGDPAKAAVLKDLPIWVFHGAKDPVVPLEQSQKMVEVIEQAGGKVKLTVYPEAGHDSWTETYDNPGLYSWFLEQSRNQ